MLGEVFYWLLNISILGTLAGLVVLLVRALPRLPRLVPYLLWAIPLIRLWVPVGLSSEYSLLSLIARLTSRTVVIQDNAGPLPPLSMSNFIMAAEDYFPITYKTNQLAGFFAIAAVIWGLITLALISTVLIAYGLNRRIMRSARFWRENIYLADRLPSPTVLGLIKPRIILPAALADQDLNFILQHENVHIRRHDNFWRLLALVTACLHWFNPFIWVYLRLYFADLEMSCDEKVLRQCGEDCRKAYARALLNCESSKSLLTSAFGGARTRDRIGHILAYMPLTLFSAICFAALILAIALILLTNAAP